MSHITRSRGPVIPYRMMLSTSQQQQQQQQQVGQERQESLLDNTLIITNSCCKRIKDLREINNDPDLRLRISVEGGGCSGFQYQFHMDGTKGEYKTDEDNDPEDDL